MVGQYRNAGCLHMPGLCCCGGDISARRRKDSWVVCMCLHVAAGRLAYCWYVELLPGQASFCASAGTVRHVGRQTKPSMCCTQLCTRHNHHPHTAERFKLCCRLFLHTQGPCYSRQ
jgi:hypothetical protein